MNCESFQNVDMQMEMLQKSMLLLVVMVLMLLGALCKPRKTLIFLK